LSDPLSDMVRVVGLEASLISRAHLGGRFGVRAPDQARAVFHVPVRGAAWIALDEGEAHRLEVGDVGVLPHGHAHRITDAAGRGCRPIGSFEVQRTQGRLPVLTNGDDELDLLCGTFRLGSPADRWVMATLPDLVAVRGGEATVTYLKATLALVDNELAHTGAGTELVLERLVEVLVMQILRRWATLLPPGTSGWLAGIHDANLGPLLAAMHADPAQDWTLERMARQSGLSRTRLAHRFRDCLGVPPNTWVTEWRLAVARQSLFGGADVATAASRAGYASEASFSRAFKRSVGLPPAAWRMAQRDQKPPA
jgi:AraC-like DNA-binding protein